MKHVRTVSPPAGSRVVPLPPGRRLIFGTGGFAASPFFLLYLGDHGVMDEGRFFLDRRRCLRAVGSLASLYFRWYGSRGSHDPPLLSAEREAVFETSLEV